VQVDEALEGALLATGEQPVDGPLLAHRQVMLVETLREVFANCRAKAFFDTGDISHGRTRKRHGS
jgi:hypothetical protein